MARSASGMLEIARVLVEKGVDELVGGVQRNSSGLDAVQTGGELCFRHPIA